MGFLAHFYIHLDFKATQEFNLEINLDLKTSSSTFWRKP